MYLIINNTFFPRDLGKGIIVPPRDKIKISKELIPNHIVQLLKQRQIPGLSIIDLDEVTAVTDQVVNTDTQITDQITITEAESSPSSSKEEQLVKQIEAESVQEVTPPEPPQVSEASVEEQSVQEATTDTSSSSEDIVIPENVSTEKPKTKRRGRRRRKK